jgi:hypothetical protein
MTRAKRAKGREMMTSSCCHSILSTLNNLTFSNTHYNIANSKENTLHSLEAIRMGQQISKSNGAAAVRAASPTAPEASPTISNKVALGAGCYWGTEKYVQKSK